jgi:hypothetical protein
MLAKNTIASPPSTQKPAMHIALNAFEICNHSIRKYTPQAPGCRRHFKQKLVSIVQSSSAQVSALSRVAFWACARHGFWNVVNPVDYASSLGGNGSTEVGILVGSSEDSLLMESSVFAALSSVASSTLRAASASAR